MENTIYRKEKLNSINSLTCEIEETFTNDYSILLYDENNNVWIEKFANTYKEATEIANKLFIKTFNQF